MNYRAICSDLQLDKALNVELIIWQDIKNLSAFSKFYLDKFYTNYLKILETYMFDNKIPIAVQKTYVNLFFIRGQLALLDFELISSWITAGKYIDCKANPITNLTLKLSIDP